MHGFLLRIAKRQEPSPLWRSALVLFGAVLVALGLSILLLALRGISPLEGCRVLIMGAFGSSWALQDCLLKAIPLFLCSLGVAIAFRLQIWNIGAEGQFALGAIGATWAALAFGAQPKFILLPLMILAACSAGGLWAMIPAIFRQWLGANEIIVTLMFNYIAILLLDFLVYGIWRDSSGFPMTPAFSKNAILGTIGTSDIHWGLVHCALLGLLCWLFFRSTRLGYEIKASGDNVQAARYAGMPYNFLVVLVMLLSGALAGWAGFLEVSASVHRLQPSIMVGYGFTAIVVAWLARLNPAGIALTSFLLAGLRAGVENLQLDLQIPAAFGAILEGLILMTVLAGGFFLSYRIVVRRQT
ncbi:MAG: ABC transporter permease [Desulfobulbaceae bacterium]|nr:ABC transporter permease [Desulfobulbaceae bacterium]